MVLVFAITLAFTGVWFISPTPVQAGLGVSPAVIEVRDILAGTQVTKTFILSRSNPITADKVKVMISGSAAPFITGASEVVLPQGKQQTPYPFTIATAGLATNEEYEATISFSFGDDEISANMSARAFPAIKATIRFTVTNDIRQEFMIKQVIIQTSEEGQPLGFSYFMINTGNVDVRPTRIDLTITDQTNLKSVYTETILGETLVPVKAFSEKDITLFTKAKLASGRYWADFTFYDGDDVVFTREQYALQITSPDMNVPIVVSSRTYRFAILGLSLIALGGLMWVIKTRRARRSRR